MEQRRSGTVSGVVGDSAAERLLGGGLGTRRPKKWARGTRRSDGSCREGRLSSWCLQAEAEEGRKRTRSFAQSRAGLCVLVGFAGQS